MDFKLKNVRISHPNGKNHLAEKSTYYKIPAYVAQILIKKDDKQVQLIVDAINSALEEGKNRFGSRYKLPEYKLGMQIGLSKFLQDGDLKDYGPLKDCYFFSPTNQSDIPCYRDKKVNGKPVILDPNEVYSGDNVHVIISAKPFMNEQGKGVGLYLQGVMATFSGEKIGGVDAEKVFADDFEDDDDEFEKIEDNNKPLNF